MDTRAHTHTHTRTFPVIAEMSLLSDGEERLICTVAILLVLEDLKGLKGYYW